MLQGQNLGHSAPTKPGGLSGNKHWNKLGICFAPDTALIGGHLGLVPISSTVNSKMAEIYE